MGMVLMRTFALLATLASITGSAAAHGRSCSPIEVFPLILQSSDGGMRPCETTGQPSSGCTCGADDYASYTACKTANPAIFDIVIDNRADGRRYSIAATTVTTWYSGNGDPPEGDKIRWDHGSQFSSATHVLSAAFGRRLVRDSNTSTLESKVFDVTMTPIDSNIWPCRRDAAIEEHREMCQEDGDSKFCAVEIKE
jgi:hypothetical protein